MLVVACLISNFLSTIVFKSPYHLHLNVHHEVQLLEDLFLSPHRSAPRLVAPLELPIAIPRSLDPVVIHPHVLQVLPLLLVQLNAYCYIWPCLLVQLPLGPDHDQCPLCLSTPSLYVILYRVSLLWTKY